MTIYRMIRYGIGVGGIAVSLGWAQPADSDRTDALNDGGRKVSVRPIGETNFGLYGGPGWGVAAGVAGIGLLAVGALVTARGAK